MSVKEKQKEESCFKEYDLEGCFRLTRKERSKRISSRIKIDFETVHVTGWEK